MKDRRSHRIQAVGLFFLFLASGLLLLGPAASFSLAEPAETAQQTPIEDKDYLYKNGKLKYAYRTSPDDSITEYDLPERKTPIIDVHEHIMNEELARLFLKQMDEFGITLAVIAGTSKYTFTLDNKYGFEDHLEHNETILKIARKFPDRYAAFPTLLPTEPGNLARLEDYVNRGAQGIKLYVGHGGNTGKGPFHVMPLDDPRLRKIYAYCEKNQLPILFHINLMKYYEEFIRVMESYPYLRINVPHFGLFSSSKAKRRRLAWLLERYPNLYIDVSFGSIPVHIQGFQIIGAWPRAVGDLIREHSDKVLFASDNVIERPWKAQEFAANTLRSYMQMLEMKKFRFFHRPKLLMRGLGLEEGVVKKIYWENPKRFLLIDEDGNLPQRRFGLPEAWREQVPGLPPATRIDPLAENSPYWKSPLASKTK